MIDLFEPKFYMTFGLYSTWISSSKLHQSSAPNHQLLTQTVLSGGDGLIVAQSGLKFESPAVSQWLLLSLAEEGL